MSSKATVLPVHRKLSTKCTVTTVAGREEKEKDLQMHESDDDGFIERNNNNFQENQSSIEANHQLQNNDSHRIKCKKRRNRSVTNTSTAYEDENQINVDGGQAIKKRKKLQSKIDSDKKANDVFPLDDRENWLQKLLNPGTTQKKRKDLDVDTWTTTKGTIEFTKCSSVGFTEIDGIEYGYFPTKNKTHGIMRFKSNAVKPMTTQTDQMMILQVMGGKFVVKCGNEKKDIRGGFLVKIPQGIQYEIKCIDEVVGVMMFNVVGTSSVRIED